MRRLSCFALACCLFAASPLSGQTVPPTRTGPLSGYLEAWSAHDAERIASYFTDDATYEDVTLGEAHRGKVAIRSFAEGTFADLPGFAIEQRSLLGGRAGEESAAIEWTMSGTERSTGKSFSVRGVSVMELEVESGKIRRNSDYWDMAVFQRQTTATVQAQNGRAADEAEIRQLHAGLDRALVEGDAAAFDRVFADDYFFSHHFGYKVDRERNLAYLATPPERRKYDVLEATSDDVEVHVHGDVAWLTAAWRTVVRATGDPDALPHADSGRYTGIYQRRDGAWRLVRDHMSEAMHDPRTMEDEVRQASSARLELARKLYSGQSYAALVDAGLIARLESTLASDFIHTDANGRRYTRAEELAAYQALDATIESAEVLDQQVHALGNTHALENTTVRYRGMHGGKPYDVQYRLTLLWSWQDMRWRLRSEHSTLLD